MARLLLSYTTMLWPESSRCSTIRLPIRPSPIKPTCGGSTARMQTRFSQREWRRRRDGAMPSYTGHPHGFHDPEFEPICHIFPFSHPVGSSGQSQRVARLMSRRSHSTCCWATVAIDRRVGDTTDARRALIAIALPASREAYRPNMAAACRVYWGACCVYWGEVQRHLSFTEAENEPPE
jgi:hypothetical protein